MRVLDLFCGAGGFSYGFALLPKSVHVAIDNDPAPLETYQTNYPAAKTVQADIRTLHSSDVESMLDGVPDIVLASPPCEEFSKANPDSSGSAADRVYGDGSASLVLDAIRLIGDLEPDVFIIENVAALIRSGGKRIVLRELEYAGVTEKIWFNFVRCHQHGNPSKRLRLFVSNVRFDLPRKKPLRVMEAIGDLPPLGLAALLEPGDLVPNHDIRPLSKAKQKKLRKTRTGRGARRFRVSKHRTLPNWVRLRPDQIATSVIGLSRYIHPYEDRLLTVREHARLMSYPDSFIFTGSQDSQYNQIGESVPPLISQLLAQEAISYIERSDG